MKYVDTHFHLDLWNNPHDLADEIEKFKIYTIAVTNTPSVFDYTYRLSKGKKYLRAALGLHPELVYQRAAELPLFMEKISKTRYIGEIGLDFAGRNISSKNEQIKVFEKIIDRCSLEGNKIITIHSRKAEQEVVEIIGNNYSGKVILHWYSGPLEILDKALEYGFYFSINHRMITSPNGRKIIDRIPINKLLTESDGPFIEIDGRKSSPLSIQQTCQKLQEIRDEKSGQLTSQVFDNFSDLLK